MVKKLQRWGLAKDLLRQENSTWEVLFVGGRSLLVQHGFALKAVALLPSRVSLAWETTVAQTLGQESEGQTCVHGIALPLPGICSNPNLSNRNYVHGIPANPNLSKRNYVQNPNLSKRNYVHGIPICSNPNLPEPKRNYVHGIPLARKRADTKLKVVPCRW